MLCVFLSAFMVSQASGTDNTNNNGNMINNADSIAYKQKVNGIYFLSIIDLIAHPELYDGKKVNIIGYMHLEFEGNILYLSKEDCTREISKNGIWLELNFSKYYSNSKRNPGKNDSYVLIEGIFDGKSNGHLGCCSGTIKDITRLEAWR